MYNTLKTTTLQSVKQSTLITRIQFIKPNYYQLTTTPNLQDHGFTLFPIHQQEHNSFPNLGVRYNQLRTRIHQNLTKQCSSPQNGYRLNLLQQWSQENEVNKLQ